MAVNILLLIGSWLVPGLGFLVKREYWRGVSLFLLINGTFLLGLLLHGNVIVPEFRYHDPGFNIVNLLTFFGELGNGGGSLLTLARMRFGWLDTPLTLFRPDETNALFDLATLYLLVSGSANYFATTSFYDRYIGRRRQGATETEGAS
jgi:hypothetical protein